MARFGLLSDLRFLGCLALFGSLLVSADGRAEPESTDDTTPTQIAVSIDAGLLSVSAKDAPLDIVLTRIAEKAGFAMEIRGDLECIVSWNMVELPVEKGLDRILQKVASVRIHGPKTAQGDHPLRRVIAWSGPRDGKTCAAPAQPPANSLEARPLNANKHNVALAGRADERQARLEAIQKMGTKPTPAAVNELISVLQQDPDAALRRQAAMQLSRIKTAKAKESLERSLGDDDPAVRVRIVQSLGVWRHQAVSPLAKVLQHDPSPKVRRIAAMMLGQSGSDDAIPALSAAERDQDQKVRRAASRAIARLRSR